MSDNLDNPWPGDYRETTNALLRDILDNTRSAEEISPSGELYRFMERFHRSRDMENRSTQELPSLISLNSEADSEVRVRLNQNSINTSPLFTVPLPPVELTSRERATARLAGMTVRRGAQRSRIMAIDHYLERRRALIDGNAASNHLLGAHRMEDIGRSMHEADRHLDFASSNLRSLLDDPVPGLSSQNVEYHGDSERRPKRRKLESDKMDTEGFAGFSYGRFGQVEPGKLKMEIVSCDGGIFKDQGARPGEFCAENVLRNDNSVYCTQSHRCNLVLRHQGGTVFNLSELIIKAPHAGYTAPVQEGMIFVSMTSDDLLTRTAQYQIQYSPPRPRSSAQGSVQGSPNTNDIRLPPIVSIQHNRDGSMNTAQARARRLVDIGLQDEDCEYRTAQIPSDFINTTSNFQVTAEGSDSEDEEEGRSRNYRSIHRMMGLRFEENSGSEDDNEERNVADWNHDNLMGLGRSPRLRRRETASNFTLAEAADAAQVATQEAVQAVGGELMIPHAKFFMERHKSKCTVKFDPPVSGRFILLKMWSPHHSPTGNIDIQTVVAKGFAGPRFFPAVDLR